MTYKLRSLNKVLKLPKLHQVYLALVESITAYGIIGTRGAFDNTYYISAKNVLKSNYSIIAK